GSSPASAALAARMGTSFACSLFHAATPATEARPLRAGIVAVSGVCASSEALAKRLAAETLGAGGSRFRCNYAGTVEQWRASLRGLATPHGTREFLVLDLSPTLSDKLRSYEGIARARTDLCRSTSTPNPQPEETRP